MTDERRGFAGKLNDYPEVLDFLWSRLPVGLYVFNYHRVGDAEATPFDPNVFSCDADTFREHVRLFKAHFDVLDAESLTRVVRDGALKRRAAVLTFDDGYRDNFTTAFPILQEENATALFYLPTALIDTPTIPWWDEIAWLVKNTKETTIRASFIHSPIPRVANKIQATIGQVLAAFKASPTPAEVKVGELRSALKCTLAESKHGPLFMSWSEAKAMSDGGMDIGSHAHSHQILAHLSREEQRRELELSKGILEERIGRPIETVAYPVGTEQAFNKDTLALAAACGYKVGFSYIQGVNTPGKMRQFELRRVAVDGNANAQALKVATLLATDVGRFAKRVISDQRRLVHSARGWIREQLTAK